MRHPIALLPLTALALLLLPAPGAAAAETALKLTPCEIKASFGTQRRDAECGTWSVAEDPAKPSGKHIDLKVAVVRARAKERDKAADPVFFLAGGPGQSAIDGFMAAPQAFERILRKRDVVLLDQRGTGGSNRMQCPEDRELDGRDAYDRERMIAATRKCLAALPGDPALYTTSLAIDDLDAVRQALGYAQINLYGGSYGTRVALSYLKYHEASTRAVIVDAVVPLILHQAANGDLAPLTAQVLLTLRQTTEMLALGMHNSVVCVEDVPFYVDDDQGEALEASSYMGVIASRAIRDMCSVWPKGPIKDGFKQAVTSAKPVLLLSGEHDPITPPAYAERAARTLSNSRHLVAPGQGHTVLARGCLPKVAAEFLDALDPKGLDASCVKEMGDTPLFVRFTGPEP